MTMHPLTFVSANIHSPIAINSIGIVSKFGVGYENFKRGLVCEHPDLDTSVCLPNFPPRANTRTEFNAVDHLGRKGLAALDRLSQLSLVACQEALNGVTTTKTRTGVVLGTSGGSFESISEFVRSTYESEAPHKVSPIKFPNTVMNCAASQCAIRFGLKGVNSTVCGGDLSGLMALTYAVRSLRQGHADTLITGSVEECCEYTAWSHQRLTDENSFMSDGCALFALGGNSENSMGEILGIKSCFTVPGPDGDIRRMRMIKRLVADCGLSARDIRWCSISTDDSRVDDELRALKNAECTHRTTLVPPWAERHLGNTHSASFSFQLAAALAKAPSGIGLLTIASHSGQFGGVLIRTK